MAANEQQGWIANTLTQWWVAFFWAVWFIGLYHGVKVIAYWRL